MGRYYILADKQSVTLSEQTERRPYGTISYKYIRLLTNIKPNFGQSVN